MTITIKKRYEKSKSKKLDTGKGLTEQSHKRETDINFILKDYAKTGFIKHAKEHEGEYDDISVQDFNNAMFIVAEAQNMFNELPAEYRQKFNNNPADFLNFVQDPSNKEQMEKMGILKGNDGFDLSGASTGAPTEKITKRAKNPSPDDTAPQKGAAESGETASQK